MMFMALEYTHNKWFLWLSNTSASLQHLITQEKPFLCLVYDSATNILPSLTPHPEAAGLQFVPNTELKKKNDYFKIFIELQKSETFFLFF